MICNKFNSSRYAIRTLTYMYSFILLFFSFCFPVSFKRLIHTLFVFSQLGSHPSTVDLEKSALPRNKSEPNWYGNNAFYNYDEEVEKEKNDFTRSLRQYSVKSEPPRRKEPLSEKSSSSGVDVSSQVGADGTTEDSYSQKL